MLNRDASEVALKFRVHSATDVTGFGLLGHARGMAVASNVSLVFDSAKVDFLPEALDYSREGHLPGGLKRNREFLEGCVEFAPGIAEEICNLFYDPQTSGGLLMAVQAEDAPALSSALRERQIPAQTVGEVIARTKPLIRVQ
jgi:selenide,water dikinase